MIEAAEIFPVYAVEDDSMLSVNGDITIAYRLHLPEVFTLSQNDYDALHHAWVKAIRTLPENAIVHKQDWFCAEAFEADFDKAGEELLMRSSERFFRERPFFSHECYLFLTLKSTSRRPSSSAYCNLLRKTIVPAQVLCEALKACFEQQCSQFVRILSDSGFISGLRLTDDELAGTANKPGIIERYCFLLARNQPSQIKDIHFKGGIKIGDKPLSLFTMADSDHLPSLCGSRVNYDAYSTDNSKFSLGFSSPLGVLLACNHIYNQYVFIDDAHAVIKKLEAKKLRLQSLSAYSRENAISRELVNDYLNEAVALGHMPLKAHFNVLTWGEGANGETAQNLVGSAMSVMDTIAKLESDGAAQIWYAGIPGNAADFPMNDTFNTFAQVASCFFNQESAYRDSISPFGMRLGDRISGKPVHTDISDEPMDKGYITNRNKFILGPSGSGKSFFTNHMVHSYYHQGTHVLLVDVGHSYKGLCEMLGGYYFSYSESAPIEFNPFFLGKGEVLDTEKKESLKTLLLALWKKDDESFRRSEYVALSNALGGYYQHLSLHTEIFPCFNSFYDFLSTQYAQILENDGVRDRDFDMQNFLYVLAPYYRGGEFDYLLNATSQLDLLNERFIVFELDNIKDHPILFPAVTLIIMEVFISKMRKLKGIRKMILIEECWKAIAKEGMAEYIKYLFKTVRKFFGEAVVVTQDVEDIISSPIVKQAIINNADCKILLDQSKYQNKFDMIQELLGLTDKERALILSMNRANDPSKKYKEVFISLGGQYSKVYRTEVSLEEYLTYSTEEKEKLLVQQYAQRYGSISKGIAILAEELRQRKN
ncbi:TraG family conjugative transposon ATPase [Pedobacter sp. Leaf194]|uniref:TraG family conjugative transposon ATPase n=1 Tax=Pedobacter sp. Leaf194 TaxID=1736297 RepID=UPI0007031742|nr:TraG family conjugative transposon ATPase [Pedobacter sp. Leaf194]KQS36843.1 conjugal transfer protein TraG [Pedobacter sp. Leaf194]